MEMTIRDAQQESRDGVDEMIRAAGRFLLRYGLVLVLAWIGAMKFTALEAKAVQPLVANSPLLAWTYRVFSVQGLSNLLGCVELTIATLIAIWPLAPRLSALGSVLATGMFLTTITFLFSTPGWEPSLGGFPALSDAGGFLLKDVVLLGAAVWSLGDSLEKCLDHGYARESATALRRSMEATR
jgi:reactive chlorine resistance protein C